MSRTAAEVNAYCDGSRDAIESVVESLTEDVATVWGRDRLVAELRGAIAHVEAGRRTMLATLGVTS